MYKAKSNIKLNIKTQQLLQKIQDQKAKYKMRNKKHKLKI